MFRFLRGIATFQPLVAAPVFWRAGDEHSGTAAVPSESGLRGRQHGVLDALSLTWAWCRAASRCWFRRCSASTAPRGRSALLLGEPFLAEAALEWALSTASCRLRTTLAQAQARKLLRPEALSSPDQPAKQLMKEAASKAVLERMGEEGACQFGKCWASRPLPALSAFMEAQCRISARRAGNSGHSGRQRLCIKREQVFICPPTCSSSPAPTVPTRYAAILDILNHAIVTSTALYDYQPRPLASPGSMPRRQAASNVIVTSWMTRARCWASAGYGTSAFPAYKAGVEHSVYVREDQRQGLARLLMQALIGTARAQGKHVMVGAIDATNAGSIVVARRYARRARCGRPASSSGAGWMWPSINSFSTAGTASMVESRK